MSSLNTIQNECHLYQLYRSFGMTHFDAESAAEMVAAGDRAITEYDRELLRQVAGGMARLLQQN